MKILVTGSAGFIGSAICERLVNNHIVYGIDNYSKYGNIRRPQDDHKNYKFLLDDCKNHLTMLSLINQVDLVIHAAASIGGIKFWNTNSLEMLVENESITTTLFYSWLKSQTKPKMIILSSSQVYENSSIFPSYEEHTDIIAPPTSAYGLQKLLLEKYTIEANRLHELSYTILRPFNVYGIGELVVKDINHVIIDLIKKIKANNQIDVYGSGEQSRTFTYIDDMVNSVELCINNKNANNQIYNVCGTETVTINQLINIIARELNKNIEINYIDTFKKDVWFRQGNIDKISKELNWYPSISLEQGIRKILNE